MTDELLRLSARRVPVVALGAGPTDGSKVVDFADGTQLLLQIRDGSVALRRLERQMPVEGIFLERIRPLIGSLWYRLWFSAPDGLEVLARVVPATTPARGQPPSRRSSDHRSIADQR